MFFLSLGFQYSFIHFNLLNFYPVTRFLVTPLLVNRYCVTLFSNTHCILLKECRPWKIVVDLFFTITFIFYEKPKRKQPALRDMSRHFHGLYSHRP